MTLTRDMQTLNDQLLDIEDGLAGRIESVDQRLTEVYEYTIARLRDHMERIACLEKQMGYKRLDIEDLEMRVSALEPADQQDPVASDDPNYVFSFEPLNRDGIHFLTEGALERVKREARDELAREIVERVKGGYWPSIGFISYERRSAIAEDIRREYRGGED